MYFYLFEHPSGYSVFKPKDSNDSFDTIAQKIYSNSGEADSLFELVNYQLFNKSNQAVENLKLLTEPSLPVDLEKFLSSSLSLKKSKKDSVLVNLGVAHKSLAEVLIEPGSKFSQKIVCAHDQDVQAAQRLIREHYCKFVPGMDTIAEGHMHAALALAYSRSEVKFNVHRNDTMIIQAINFIDTLDKDINIYLMRIREWFSHHYPELGFLISDSKLYIKVVNFIKSRDTLSDSSFDKLYKIVKDEELVAKIIRGASTSMGIDLSENDRDSINDFCQHALKLIKDRDQTLDFLKEKLSAVAPNLQTLIGPHVSARLISHAGGLCKLAKCAASTLQILGAEKALFRAIKTRSRTPKYGIIFNCTQISQAGKLHKGKMSRILSSKCSIAARLDLFQDNPCNIYGVHLKKFLDECLRCLKEGLETPRTIDIILIANQEMRNWLSNIPKTITINTNQLALTGSQNSIKLEENSMELSGEIVKKKRKKNKNPELVVKEKNTLEDVNRDISNSNMDLEEYFEKPKKSRKIKTENSIEMSNLQDQVAVENINEHIKEEKISEECFQTSLNFSNPENVSKKKKKKSQNSSVENSSHTVTEQNHESGDFLKSPSNISDSVPQSLNNTEDPSTDELSKKKKKKKKSKSLIQNNSSLNPSGDIILENDILSYSQMKSPKCKKFIESIEQHNGEENGSEITNHKKRKFENEKIKEENDEGSLVVKKKKKKNSSISVDSEMKMEVEIKSEKSAGLDSALNTITTLSPKKKKTKKEPTIDY